MLEGVLTILTPAELAAAARAQGKMEQMQLRLLVVMVVMASCQLLPGLFSITGVEVEVGLNGPIMLA
jgi:hypothetical protein